MFIRGLTFFSGFSHFFYGIIALYHPFFIAEFERYGFADYRVFIGVVQALLGLGLLGGFYFHKIKMFAALGLIILMLGALLTRIYIGDTLIQAAPAIFYLFINFLIFRNTIKSVK
jgi:hypothetical protein